MHITTYFLAVFQGSTLGFIGQLNQQQKQQRAPSLWLSGLRNGKAIRNTDIRPIRRWIHVQWLPLMAMTFSEVHCINSALVTGWDCHYEHSVYLSNDRPSVLLSPFKKDTEVALQWANQVSSGFTTYPHPS